MNFERQLVYLIEDDSEVSESISAVLKSGGYSVQSFSTVDEFLPHCRAGEPYCLIVDLLLPGTSGMELCRDIYRLNIPCSFVVLSGHATIPMVVEAMQLGAIEFLEKPVGMLQILDVVRSAMDRARLIHGEYVLKMQYLERLAQLTAREREILDAIAKGLLTKEVAKLHTISTRTVDVHRSRIMNKLGIESPAQLAKIISILNMSSSTVVRVSHSIAFGVGEEFAPSILLN
jgi:FixJ family two-component response regulator